MTCRLISYCRGIACYAPTCSLSMVLFRTGLILSLLFITDTTGTQPATEVKVGSKAFTESVILGEIVAQLARTQEPNVKHLKGLGGTRVLWNALLKGEIDIYPEYTGTITQEILAAKNIRDEETLKKILAEKNVLMSSPLGFNNTYAIGMKEDVSEGLGITKISDLRKYPKLKFGFTNEFMDRGDGWPSLRKAYNLPQKNVRGLDHDLAYRGLESRSIDIIDLYSTDAEIRYYKLRVLDDDLHHFPEYNAVLLYRSDLMEHGPDVLKTILQLEGRIPEKTMIDMNAEVKLDGISESVVASEFLQKNLSITTEPKEETFLTRLVHNTLEHLFLVAISLAAAIFISIPVGIRESAEALGLPSGARLRLVELPMASRSILAGIKTSAVINVGTATLGALIGAGGYGQPILTGIRLDDVGLILEGAVPAAGLALLVQYGFEWCERLITPPGLRPNKTSGTT